MGECIISRAGGVTSGGEIIGYDKGKIIVTVLGSDNTPLENVAINCNDAGTIYNYSTNSSGKAVFYPTSGWANLNIKNGYSNNVLFTDQSSLGWYNVEVPLGTSINHTVRFNARSGQISILNGNYTFLITSSVDLNMSGAIGGSGGSWNVYQDRWQVWSNVPGGRGGYANTIIANNIGISKGTVYRAYVGAQGYAGTKGNWYISEDFEVTVYSNPTDGGSGGTSLFLGKSAVGGGGGYCPTEWGDQSSWKNGTDYGSWTSAGYIKVTLK